MDQAYPAGGHTKRDRTQGGQGSLFAKLNMQQPYGPAIALLSVYPREMKTCIHTKIYAQMFLAILCIVKLETTQRSFNQQMGKLWLLWSITQQ